MSEQTLVLIKPDAVYSGWAEEIKAFYANHGLFIIQEFDPFTLSREQAEEFYAEHKGKFFFGGLVLSMTSSPTVALVLEDENVISRVRQLNGATDPSKAEEGTVRREFRSAGGPFNTVHGSDSIKSANREINLIRRWQGALTK